MEGVTCLASLPAWAPLLEYTANSHEPSFPRGCLVSLIYHWRVV